MKRNLLVLSIIFSLATDAQTLQPGTAVVSGFEVSGIARYQNNLFICGIFDTVGSTYVPNLAMLYADTGTLQSWRPAPNGPVDVILVQNGMLIVGGEFTVIAGQPRNYIAVFDAATGALLPTAPVTTQMVTALYADGNNIYFNCFSSGGFQIKYFDLSTGAVSSWGSDTFAAYDAVNAIVKVGNYIYAGGSFTANYSYLNISNLARYSVASGHLDTSFVMGSAQTDWVSQILSYNGNIYVCGSFDSLGNYPAYGFLAMDSTGVPTSFNFAPTGGQTLSMFPQGNTLWVGGNSFSFGYSNTSPYLAQIDLSTGIASCWDHPIYENWTRTDAIYVSNDTVWAGCMDANNNFNMYVGNPYYSTVSVTVSASATILSSTLAYDTFTITQPGVFDPSYTYIIYRNGQIIGSVTSGQTFIANGWNNNDSVWIEMVGYSCNNYFSPIYAYSNRIGLHVLPSVAITSNQVTLCSNTSRTDTFYAHPLNAFSSPSFQWHHNNNATGSNDSIWTLSNLNDGDSVWVVMTDSIYTWTSNKIYISLFPSMPDPVLSQLGPGCIGHDTLILSGASAATDIVWKAQGNSVANIQPAIAGSWTYVDRGHQGTLYPYSNIFFIDASGNAYLGDGLKIEPGGKVDTTNAHGNGIYCNSLGEIYGAEAFNNSVFKWEPGSINQTVVAGTGQPGSTPYLLWNPNSVYGDAAGNIYVLDNNNYRVQKWAPGAISGTTVAGGHGQGSASNQLNNPSGIYVDANGVVYIADAANFRVQKWMPGDSTGTTVAGGNGSGNAANQVEPSGVFVDASGNVYVSDAANNRIQKWASGSTAGVTVAGGNGYGPSTSQLSYPAGVQVDRNGNIYTYIDYSRYNGFSFIDSSGIVKWSNTTGIDTTFIPSVGSTYTAVMTDANGCVYTSNPVVVTPRLVTNDYVTTCDDSSYTFAGHVLHTSGVYHETLTGAGGCDSVVALTLNILPPIQAIQAAASTCQGGWVESGGIIDSTAGTEIIHYQSVTGCDSAIIFYLNIYTPDSLIISRRGGQCATIDTLLLSGQNTDAPFTWTRNGQVISTVTPSGVTIAGRLNNYGNLPDQLWEPNDVFIDHVGNLYVSDYANQRIQRFAPGDTVGVTVAGGNGNGSAADQLSYPSAIWVDGSTNLYVSDMGNNRIQKWAPGDTAGTTVAGGNNGINYNLCTSSSLCFPGGIFMDQSNNLYIADSHNNRVQKWAPGDSAGVTVAGGNLAGSALDQLNYPTDIFVDAQGNVFIADAGNFRIVKWAPGDTVGTLIANTWLVPNFGYVSPQPNSIWLDRNNNIYITCNNTVIKYAPGDSLGFPVAGTIWFNFTDTSTALAGPHGIFVDSASNIYIADTYYDRIQKWSPIDTTLIVTTPGAYQVQSNAYCSFSSNTIQIRSNNSSFIHSICPGSSYVFGGHTLTQAGTYTDTLISSSGCDSIVTLHLSIINTVPSTISRSGNVLTDNTSAQHYQWLLNGVDIAGDTSVSITITQNGYYNAVLTDANGCIQSSDTLHIINAGIGDISPLETVSIHPNPATETCTITISGGIGSYHAELTDMTGKVVAILGDFKTPAFIFPVSQYAKGVYLLRISDHQGDSSVNKLIVE